MKTSNKTLGALLITWLLWALLVSWVSAYKWDPSVQWPNYTAERHDAMENAFETKNYQAWATLMEGKWNVTNVITADNFSKFAEAHELAENGDLEGAKAIRTELGLWLKNGSGNWKGKGMWKWMWNGSWTRGNNGNCQYAK